MAYVTAVTDRSQSDISSQTAKAFFEVADWVRVYDNAFIVNALIAAVYSQALTFDTVAVPTTVTVPTKTNLNLLLANIERMRLWVFSNHPDDVNDPLFVEVKDDWDEGAFVLAPDFTNANRWEKVLDIMHVFLAASNVRRRIPRAGIAQAGVGLIRNDKFRPGD